MDPMGVINDLYKSEKTCVACFQKFQHHEFVKHYVCGDAIHQFCYCENNHSRHNRKNLEVCPMEHALSSERWMQVKDELIVHRQHRRSGQPGRPRKRPYKKFKDPRGWIKHWRRPPTLDVCERCTLQHSGEDQVNLILHKICGKVYHGNCAAGQCIGCNWLILDQDCVFRDRSRNQP